MSSKMDQLKPWQNHLAKYRKAHPTKSLSECMKAASLTFKKKAKAPAKPKAKKQKGGKIDITGNQPVGTISDVPQIKKPARVQLLGGCECDEKKKI